jgi:hypothetical protein
MSEGPTIPTRYRIPLRVSAVFGAYVIFRFVGDERVVPALLFAAGFVLVMWAIADQLTLAAHQRLGLLQAGSALLGVGLAIAAAIQLFG